MRTSSGRDHAPAIGDHDAVITDHDPEIRDRDGPKSASKASYTLSSKPSSSPPDHSPNMLVTRKGKGTKVRPWSGESPRVFAPVCESRASGASNSRYKQERSEKEQCRAAHCRRIGGRNTQRGPRTGATAANLPRTTQRQAIRADCSGELGRSERAGGKSEVDRRASDRAVDRAAQCRSASHVTARLDLDCPRAGEGGPALR